MATIEISASDQTLDISSGGSGDPALLISGNRNKVTLALGPYSNSAENPAIVISGLDNYLLLNFVSIETGGAVAIQGSSGIDQIVNNYGTVRGNVLLGGGDDFFQNNRDSVVGDVFGGDGNDWIGTYQGTVAVRYFGEAGADGLSGGSVADYLDGGTGDDRLYGNSGDDVLVGGSGADWFEGGAGDDQLIGGGDEGDLVRFDVLMTDATINIANGAGTLIDKTGNLGADVIDGIHLVRFRDQLIDTRISFNQFAMSDVGQTYTNTELRYGGLAAQLTGRGSTLINQAEIRGTYIRHDYVDDHGQHMQGSRAAVAVNADDITVRNESGASIIGIGNAIGAADNAVLDAQHYDPPRYRQATDLQVINSGLVRSAEEAGIFGGDVVSVTNNAGGVIEAATAGVVGHTVTVSNSGVIRATGDPITGRPGYSVSGSRVSLTNSGTIEGTISTQDRHSEITNTGTISGGYSSYGGLTLNNNGGESHGDLVIDVYPVAGQGNPGYLYSDISNRALFDGSIHITGEAQSFVQAPSPGTVYRAEIDNSGVITGDIISDPTLGASPAGGSLDFAFMEYVVNTGRIDGDVKLGDGDDWLTNSGTIGGVADGGAGQDVLGFNLSNGATVDLAAYVGFEIAANGDNPYGLNYPAGSAVRFVNGDGFTSFVSAGRDAAMTIAETNAPTAVAEIGRGATSGTLTLEASATIGQVGRADPALAEANNAIAALSQTVSNGGHVVGNVYLNVGNDIYDGSAGDVGGTVYGYAGKDRLSGGASADRFEGGYGDDELYGGGASDTLKGDAGNDRLDGGLGADKLTGGAGDDVFAGTRAELAGDTIMDFAVGDRILISDADLAQFSFTRSGNVLTFGTGQSLTLSGFGREISARAAAGGGVELVVKNSVLGDANGDGRADIVWRSEDGTLTNWLGQANGSFTANKAIGFIGGVATSWKVAATADLNGDGRTDILWRHDNGALIDWLATNNGGYAANNDSYVSSIPPAWKLAAVGDINGDGRADILWRNENGALTDWLGSSSGKFVANDRVAYTAAVPAAWKVAGLADFNGDGRADILWRHENGSLTSWLGRADGGFTANDRAAYVGGISTSWHVAGLGDINGDGRADLLWRNTNGAITDWLGRADGGLKPNDAVAFVSKIPIQWSLEQLADFNGDGRADILWRKPDGSITDWLGRDDGSFFVNDAVAAAHAPVTWHPQFESFAPV